jgi:predicted transcriptional regulator of viral defense system
MKTIALIRQICYLTCMQFQQLLEVVQGEPVFESGLLLAGPVDPRHVRQQLSRWVKAGRIYQLRRGLYALAPPYQKTLPHPFLVANRLVRASYASLQSALAHYGLIPEAVPVTTSVTTGRPGRWETPLGVFEFQHVHAGLFSGYERTRLNGGQSAFVARPEKALLDLVYLTPGAADPAYLDELRLQNLELLDLQALGQMAERSGKAKLRRAAALIAGLRAREAAEYEAL